MTQENIYEGLFILDSERYARNPEEVSAQIAKTIESFGGKVQVSRLWEERKLAYPIKNHRRGTYWLTYFRLLSDKVVELNRQFQLNSNILRFLLIRIDPALEETLIQHALAGPMKREDVIAKAPVISYDDLEAEDVDLVDSLEEE